MTVFAFPSVPLCLSLSILCLEALAIHSKHSSRLDTRVWRLLTGKPLSGHRPAEQRGVRGAFESDMRLTSQQLADLLQLHREGQQQHQALRGEKRRVKRKAVAHLSYLWPSNIVPYRFHPDFPESYEETVLKAMDFWQSRTCIQFVPESDSLSQYLRHPDHVLFTVGEGCQSSIGRVSTGEQTTEIADLCNEFGSVAHELGHVLGFYHEQSRPDRDDYVIILRDNILQGRHHNFLKYSSNEIMTEEPYDIGSVMHYGPTLVSRSCQDKSDENEAPQIFHFPKYFSKDGLSLTIDTEDETYRAVMGQRESPSFIDIKTINEVYNCSDNCDDETLRCRNTGYIGPDCTCMCPTGLTGEDCTDVVPSSHECGGVFTSTSGVLQSPGYDDGDDYDNYVDCFWLLQGPSGSRPVTVTLSKEVFEVEDDVIQPCAFDWMEVRTLGPHLNGQRFCGEGPSNTIVYHSHGTGLVVHFHSDESFTFRGFRLRYVIHVNSTDEYETSSSLD